MTQWLLLARRASVTNFHVVHIALLKGNCFDCEWERYQMPLMRINVDK